MDGIRIFYKYCLSSILLFLGVICALASIATIWNLLSAPTGLGLVWTTVMAAAAFLALTNSYRAYSGRGRLKVERKIENWMQHVAHVPEKFSKIPVIGPIVCSIFLVVASPAVFVAGKNLLWEAIGASANSFGLSSLFAKATNPFIWPLLDSNAKAASLILSVLVSMMAIMLVNTLFARTAERTLSWSPARIVFAVYGIIFAVGCIGVVIGIRGLSPPLVAAAIPNLLAPGYSYWQLRIQRRPYLTSR